MSVVFTENELEKIARVAESFYDFYAIVKHQMDDVEAKEYWDNLLEELREEQAENEAMDEIL